MSRGNKTNHKPIYARQEDMESVKTDVKEILTNHLPHLKIRVDASLWLSGVILAVLISAMVLQFFGVI